MPEYLSDERILFKHKAEYFIGDISPTSTKVNKSGDFIITTIRVLYVADDGTTSFESSIVRKIYTHLFFTSNECLYSYLNHHSLMLPKISTVRKIILW